jgi:Na+-transporting methylmalonyl-CoA/oxaloacetate decarboxylase gamma subunit
MIEWSLAIKICVFGLSAVFVSLAVLIASIYIFGIILKSVEKNTTKKAGSL